MINPATLEQIRRQTDLVGLAQHLFRADIQQESEDEVRILGQGGLLINPPLRVWYSFRDSAGGDCFDLVAYERYGQDAHHLGSRFLEVVREVATFAGITLDAEVSDVSPDVVSPIEDDDPRPWVDVSQRDIPAIARRIWDTLLSQPHGFYEQSGRLVWLRRQALGGVQLVPMDPARLTGLVARAVRCVQRRGKGQHLFIVEPPLAVINDMLVHLDPRLPTLTHVVRAPVFAPNGSLIQLPGYDPGSGIYYDPVPGLVMPPIPERPDRAEVARARTLMVDELLADFPFASSSDQTHAVALALLPFVRPMIAGPTPLHLIEAPVEGSGKGLLAQVLLIPALGTPPSAMAEAGTDEEWRKRVTSALLDDEPAILIDNVNRTLASGALASVLTAAHWKDRVLGRTEMVEAAVRCIWVATANNPQMSKEILRRCVSIRLTPTDPEPAMRSQFHHPDLRRWAIEHRGELIWAALVLIRHGLANGRPTGTLGSFEHWAACMGRILNGLGMMGFLTTFDRLREQADIDDLAWRIFIRQWRTIYGFGPVKASELLRIIQEYELDLPVGGGTEHAARTALGNALMRLRDRVFALDDEEGACLVSVAAGDTHQGARRYRLLVVRPASLHRIGMA